MNADGYLQVERLRLRKQGLDSFDFEPYSSEAQVVTMEDVDAKQQKRVDKARWTLTFVVGVVTALVAVAIQWTAERLVHFKFTQVKGLVNHDTNPGVAYLAWVGIASMFALAAAIPILWNPIAKGSGISEIKCVLNGVKLPRATRISTLLAKASGIVFSTAAGLPVGKEGPMIHSGAVVGAGLSQGKSTTLGFDTSYTKFREFRNDAEKRDFIVCGTTAGVAAAFGAPIGGVLFALEEGATYWFQNLTWRSFFAAMVSTYVLDVCLSAISPGKGYKFGDLSQPGMFTFGDFTLQNELLRSYRLWELPIFLSVGVAGGIIGAGFNGLNRRLTLWRRGVVTSNARKLGEVLIVAFVVSSFAFIAPYAEYVVRKSGACTKVASINGTVADPDDLVRFYCGEGEYSEMATLFFVPAETTLRQLFHFPDSLDIGRLVLFFLSFGTFTCWTYGISVASGLFIPSLLTGSAFGRIVGEVINLIAGDKLVDAGTYSLIGAAAMLGGMARMTISLAVILLESTGDYQMGLPLMLALLMARWTGNAFNHGLYDIHIEINGWPMLEPEPDSCIHQLRVRDIMAIRPFSVPAVVRVGDLVDLLESTTHHGYPVIHPREEWKHHPRLGTMAGIILRKHLCSLLHFSTFMDDPPVEPISRDQLRSVTRARLAARARKLKFPIPYAQRKPILTWDDLEGTYPRYPTIDKLSINERDREKFLDLRPYMSRSPPVVKESAPAIHAFRMFRGLGLRHLCVLNELGDVTGIITRSDLTDTKLRNRARTRDARRAALHSHDRAAAERPRIGSLGGAAALRDDSSGAEIADGSDGV